jgi:hypothetical protein
MERGSDAAGVIYDHRSEVLFPILIPFPAFRIGFRTAICGYMMFIQQADHGFPVVMNDLEDHSG